MKIQCQSCQAKYTIADEKVAGKVVKIRCKKCGATIVINGNEQPHALDQAGAPNDLWTVNVADGDQRTMTVAEIASEYRAGVINDETYCWKDGMADWLPLREIEPIYAAVATSDDASIPPQSAPPPAAPLFAAAASAATSPAESPFAASAHANGHGASALFGGGAEGALAEQHAPAAARRAGGRAQGADLFGNVEKAGGEDDVMTSASTGGALGAGAAPAGEEKLTGQRNESSVLFSLAALTEKPAETPDRTTASADGSGLIDIRALSANMDAGEKKDTNARVDDIMNLSGGGAFGAALAAPILAHPPLEPVNLGAIGADAPSKQNKTLIFAILGGFAFIAIAIFAAMVLKDPGEEASGASPTLTTTTAIAVADPATAMTTTPAAETSAPAESPPPPTVEDTPTPPPPGTGQSASKTAPVNTPPKAAGGGGAKAVAAAAPAPAPAPAPASKASKATDLSGALAEAAGKKAEPSSPSGGSASTAPFDRGAAAASLGSVNVQSCKKADGPTGSGHVTVTFGPNGSVQSAVIDGGPFPGTSVGGCIAGKYRGARVPAFGGAPVRVGKSFTVN